jgi:hypothetical protein
MPAIVLMLLACIVGLQFAGLQLRLQDAAADAARSVGRGDDVDVARSRLGGVVRTATMDITHTGDLVCVSAAARAPAGIGMLLGLTLHASSCAMDGGR